MISTANSTIQLKGTLSSVEDKPLVSESRMKVIWDQLKQDQANYYGKKREPVHAKPSIAPPQAVSSYFDFVNS